MIFCRFKKAGKRERRKRRISRKNSRAATIKSGDAEHKSEEKREREEYEKANRLAVVETFNGATRANAKFGMKYVRA